ncbi:methyltransferase domain-containing protein [Acidobacteriota bacterium]
MKKKKYVFRFILILSLVFFISPFNGAAFGQSFEDRIVEKLDIKEGMIVADVGAGNGELSVKMARIVGPEGHVYANEIDKDRIRKIRSRIEEQSMDNITIILGEVEDAVLPAKVDLIVLKFVYHHLTSPDIFMKNLLRYLKPGGRLAVIAADINQHNPARANRENRDACISDPEETKKAVEEGGYQFEERADVKQSREVDYILFFKASEVVRESSLDLKQITFDSALDYHVKWSPDGKMLAFTSQRDGEPEIWIIPTEGGSAVKLETGLSGDHHISWSPEGTHLTFDASPTGPPCIYTILTKGSTPKKLTLEQGASFHPNWSPNGKSIAFASFRGSSSDIWIMPSEGGQSLQLTNHEATDYHPVWSPDGLSIAFSSKRQGNYDIWEVSTSGGDPTQLTFHKSDDDHVCWSPDGTKIAFMSNRSGKRDIWIKSLPDGKPVRFTEKANNSWPNWSPNGKKIAFASDRAGNLDIWVKDIK